MPSHSQSLALLALALVALAMTPPSGLAQNPGPPQPITRGPAGEHGPTLDLDFPGGTAADYIAAIRKAQPDANIVTLGELGKVNMPAVHLQNVNVDSAVRVLEAVPENQEDLLVNVQVSNIAGPDQPPVLRVVAQALPMQKTKPKPRTQETIVISMADLLGEHLKPADALTAIETAMDLLKADYEPAQIKFHEETGLLIARSSPEQVQSISEVVQQLRQRGETIQSRRDREAMQQEAQRRSAENARDAKNLRTEYDVLAQQVTEWRTKADLLQQEIDKMRKMMADIEGENRHLRAEYARLAGGAPPTGADKPGSDNSRKPQ